VTTQRERKVRKGTISGTELTGSQDCSLGQVDPMVLWGALFAYRKEISSVRTVVAKLDQLPAGDAVRVEFSPRLAEEASALERSIEDKEDVSRAVGLVRLKLDKRRATVNLLRTEIYGELLTITKAKKTADRFFRTGAGKAKDSDEEQPALNPAPGTPVVPPVVP
jgi:hypothetical protein